MNRFCVWWHECWASIRRVFIHRDTGTCMSRLVAPQERPVERSEATLSRRTVLPRHTPWIALGIYSALSFALFGMRGNYSTNVLGMGPDPWAFVWYLWWWPYAIGHLMNPLYSQLVWFPTGYSMTWTTSIPTLALFGLPVTLFSNAVVAYNVLALLAPAISAWTAFLLCRRITRDHSASFVGGLLFGFSSYEVGQMLGHLNLTFIFLIPAIVYLVIERLDGTVSRRRFIGGLVLCLVLQFGISTEIFATLTVLGAGVWLIFLGFADADHRRRLTVTGFEIASAYAMLFILLSPYLISMARTRHDMPQFWNPPELYSTDVLNFFFPTPVTWSGSALFADIAGHFPGNEAEQGAYLGLPLLLIIALYAQTAQRWGRALIVTTAVLAIASLGPRIWINGHETIIPGPWRLFSWLPLMRAALPSRFTMYVSFAAALVTAHWLTGATTRCGRLARLVLGCASYLALLPNVSLVAWRPLPLLPFFSPVNVEAVLGRNANVLVLPYMDGPGMLWQWESGMRFTQSGGGTSLVPLSFSLWPVVQTLSNGQPNQSFATDFLAFCNAKKVAFVLVGPGTTPALVMALENLRWPQEQQGGVLVLRVPQPR
jgi:ABC-type proline/glycine betaine transport system permease subunit